MKQDQPSYNKRSQVIPSLFSQDAVSAVDIEQYINGVSFPCHKEDLIEHALANGAPDDVVEAMGRLPDQEFHSLVDVARGAGVVRLGQ
jgi:hypothetical protein